MKRSYGFEWVTILTALVALTSPLAASAASHRSGTVQLAPAAQLVVSADLRIGGSEAEMIEVVATDAILYRFTLEIVSRNGRSGHDAGWEATIFLGSQFMRVDLVRMSAGQQEMVLPRPLGFTVAAGDSLGIRVTLPAASDSVHLRLVAEYEPLQRRFSRFPAIPAPATPEEPGMLPAGSVSWLWEAPVSGWLLALVGMNHANGSELVLQDAESGKLIWRHVFEPPVNGSPNAAAAVVLVGTTVEAGRSYRLIAISADAAAAAPVHALHAMVLPTPNLAMRSNGN
jgi:hypothetical protein